MGNAVGELKRIPAWGWIAIGLILVGALVWHARSKSSSSTSTNNALPQPSTAGAFPDPNDVATMQLQELSNIEQLLQAQTSANSNLSQSTANTAQSIQDLYQGLLGRAADAQGLAFFTGEANNFGLGRVATDIAGTPEAVQHEVSGLYQSQLGRAPDSQGLAYWQDYISQHGYAAAQAAIAQSPEAIGHHTIMTPLSTT